MTAKSTMQLKRRDRYQHFGGYTEYYQHQSEVCDCTMRFAIFEPPQAKEKPCPVIYFLSGLTCTEENFTVKSGAQRFAAEHGVWLVIPDTSPRGVLEDVSNSDYVGPSASYYINATQQPWAKHYQMFDYVNIELPNIINANFPVDSSRESIMGHSMGGHGALISHLRQPGRFKSISVFAPVSNPSIRYDNTGPLMAYLGDNPDEWKNWDATELVKQHGSDISILIDQGADDELLPFLMPDNLLAACETAKVKTDYRLRPGYRHNYFYVSTFIHEHIEYHANILNQ